MRGRGFTMVELLLVIGIIAILAAILFPVFARAREKAREASCRANLLNIAMGLRAYAHDHEGLYPPAEDDLAPLYPRYLPIEQVFICPSQAEGIPMGAPANEDVWPAAQPTGTGPGEPGQLGHQEPPRPEGPPGMMRVPEEYAEGTLVT
ncbi:MAG: type II secretion system protein, partial [Armatimonadota bacterium]